MSQISNSDRSARSSLLGKERVSRRPLAAWILGMIVVQLSLIGEPDGYGLLSTNNTSGGGAERSFGPSIRQKVVEVLGRYIKPSPITTKTTEQVVKVF